MSKENVNEQIPDISKLSSKQLYELEQQIQGRKEAERAEKNRLAKVKAAYQLHIPQPKNIEVETNNFAIIRDLVAYCTSSPDAPNPQKLAEIIARNAHPKHIDNSAFYECPHCGKTGYLEMLQEWFPNPNNPSFGKSGKYYLECRCCQWVSPKKIWDTSKYDVWDSFHTWLIEKGYLKNNDTKPEETMRKNLSQLLAENHVYCLDLFR